MRRPPSLGAISTDTGLQLSGTNEADVSSESSTERCFWRTYQGQMQRKGTLGLCPVW